MFIHELAQRTGISAKTIRYYESVGPIPDPQRAANNYCQYPLEAVERISFIVGARSLGFSLTEIGELLLARDAGPCRVAAYWISLTSGLQKSDPYRGRSGRNICGRKFVAV